MTANNKMIIKLPYPSVKLNPNQSTGKHWSATKAIKQEHKECAYYITKQELNGAKLEAKKYAITITFVKSTKVRYDLDNALASCKHYLDGIAQALGMDDSQFEPITLKRGYAKGSAHITVEITC